LTNCGKRKSNLVNQSRRLQPGPQHSSKASRNSQAAPSRRACSLTLASSCNELPPSLGHIARCLLYPFPASMAMMLLARNLRSGLRPPLSAAFSSAPAASAAAAEAGRAIRDGPRNDWSRPEIQAVYDSPLLDLLFHGVRTPARHTWHTAWNGMDTSRSQIPPLILCWRSGLVLD
jgi:hypothetical protein